MEYFQQTHPFWHDLIIKPKRPVYRMDGKDNRYYHTVGDDGNVHFFPSVTSIIQATTPTPYHLIKWYADYGMKRAEQLRDEKAHYGTVLHILIATLLKNGEMNLDATVQTMLYEYADDKGLTCDIGGWVRELQRDLLAFNQFAADYAVTPVAIEMPLVSKRLGYGGAIDLTAEITIEEKGFWGDVYASGANKGQPKETKRARRVVAIIDFKSGRHGFYESNEIQANMYLDLWNDNHPELPAERCMNWRPKDWQGDNATYELKDQTGRESAAQIPLLLALFSLREREAPAGVQTIGGTITLGQTGGNVGFTTVAELAKLRSGAAA